MTPGARNSCSCIGGMFGLTPLGLIKLAAFFAVLKLAIAAICAIHLIDRFRSLVSGKAEADVLEAGLILIVAISILAVGPAVWSQNVELARDYTVQLVLAALVAALCLVERRHDRTDAVDAAARRPRCRKADAGSRPGADPVFRSRSDARPCDGRYFLAISAITAAASLKA